MSAFKIGIFYDDGMFMPTCLRTSVKGYCQTAGSAWKRARAKTIQGECIGSTHSNLRTFWTMHGTWYESADDHVTRQAASDRQQSMWWQGLLQVCTWHDRSYIAGIPLLAHGLTVKLYMHFATRPGWCSIFLVITVMLSRVHQHLQDTSSTTNPLALKRTNTTGSHRYSQASQDW